MFIMVSVGCGRTKSVHYTDGFLQPTFGWPIKRSEFWTAKNTDHVTQIKFFQSAHVYGDGMKILESATRWHFDGTFKTFPTHFHQILSIHCLYQNRMVPAPYILLQNKERETYIKAFTSVKEILVINNYTFSVQDTLTASSSTLSGFLFL
ncbi:hypothetical protein BpHYR1_040084 [Brachionus plicatilis]|uniref:Uncharacterized protein n=1 Tax=Brachionus plicatilis TaxID=10195 RepID=A0A3M7QL23_BRAPC|nr:hypothetical protein BpHYR1_040084 [Brachionus plicatilis]